LNSLRSVVNKVQLTGLRISSVPDAVAGWERMLFHMALAPDSFLRLHHSVFTYLFRSRRATAICLCSFSVFHRPHVAY
jgi:hypothetical protein